MKITTLMYSMYGKLISENYKNNGTINVNDYRNLVNYAIANAKDKEELRLIKNTLKCMKNNEEDYSLNTYFTNLKEYENKVKVLSISQKIDKR